MRQDTRSLRSPRHRGVRLLLASVGASIALTAAPRARADIPAGWIDGSATWYVTPGWEETNCPIPAALRPGKSLMNSYTNPTRFKHKRTVQLVRKEVSSLTAAEKATLKLGWSLLQALPDSDPRSMVRLAAVHCIYCGNDFLRPEDQPPTGDIHGGPDDGLYFLPFHRAFLYSTEDIMRALLAAEAKKTADPADDAAAAEFALPFWNWARNPIDPIYFSGGGSTSLPDVTGNPLVDLDPFTRSALAANFGALMTTQDPDVFFSTAVSYSGPHVTPHNDTQGWMRNPLHSARTPLFYAHHGNVDRLWALWTLIRKRNTPPKTNTIAPSNPNFSSVRMVFPNGEGDWIAFTAADVQDHTTLGYSYR